MKAAEALKVLDLENNALLIDNTDWNEEFEIEKISSENSSLPPKLIVETSENYSWSLRKEFIPLHYTLEQIARTISILNREMILYLKLLSAIESGLSFNEKEFAKLSNSAKIIFESTAKFANLPELKSYSGIISDSAGLLLQNYLKTKNKKLLEKIVNSNQDTVQKWADLYIIILRTSAVNIKRNYSLAMIKFYEPQNEKELSKKKKCEMVFNLNDKLIKSLEKMKIIEDTVSKIPKIHALIPEKNEKLSDLLIQLEIIDINLDNENTRRKKMKSPLETADNLSKIFNRCAYLKAKISASNNDEQKNYRLKYLGLKRKFQNFCKLPTKIIYNFNRNFKKIFYKH